MKERFGSTTPQISWLWLPFSVDGSLIRFRIPVSDVDVITNEFGDEWIPSIRSVDREPWARCHHRRRDKQQQTRTSEDFIWSDGPAGPSSAAAFDPRYVSLLFTIIIRGGSASSPALWPPLASPFLFSLIITVYHITWPHGNNGQASASHSLAMRQQAVQRLQRDVFAAVYKGQLLYLFAGTSKCQKHLRHCSCPLTSHLSFSQINPLPPPPPRDAVSIVSL